MGVETHEQHALLPEQIAEMRERAAGDRRLRSMMNAVTKTGIEKVALNRDAIIELHDAFSHQLPSPSVTNQMKSGRCWMFAGLNVLRRAAATRLNVEEFELSQNYLTFFEKLEKANGYLGDILATLREPKDGRLVSWLLATPVEDGGEWELFANLVLKYGVVPKWTMPETHHSSDSRTMNYVLNLKLREQGLRLREAHAAGTPITELVRRKEDMLEAIYRILTVFLGTPPATFDFEYRDKEETFHRDADLTPLTFFTNHVGFAFDAYASVVNVPTAEKPFGRTYVVSHLPVVRGGPARPYLNVDAETLRSIALAQLQSGECVYFGCDVGQMMDADAGVLDSRLYDLEGVFDMQFGLTKAERLDYGGEIAGGHQMVFTGVHVVDGKPLRWKVENSWGAELGQKGYFVMSDSWFSDYVYQVVVRSDQLSPELQAQLGATPIVLPPWDPMRGL
jgi:bleomycin hydrolase